MLIACISMGHLLRKPLIPRLLARQEGWTIPFSYPPVAHLAFAKIVSLPPTAPFFLRINEDTLASKTALVFMNFFRNKNRGLPQRATRPECAALEKTRVAFRLPAGQSGEVEMKAAIYHRVARANIRFNRFRALRSVRALMMRSDAFSFETTAATPAANASFSRTRLS